MDYTNHAIRKMVQRGISPAWVEFVLKEPDISEKDPRSVDDPKHIGVMRAWRKIPEADHRSLRVVYRLVNDEVLVITAFLDRDAR